MSKNVPVSEVSGGCMLGIFRPRTKLSNILTFDYTTMGVAMETSHIFEENYHL